MMEAALLEGGLAPDRFVIQDDDEECWVQVIPPSFTLDECRVVHRAFQLVMAQRGKWCNPCFLCWYRDTCPCDRVECLVPTVPCDHA